MQFDRSTRSTLAYRRTSKPSVIDANDIGYAVIDLEKEMCGMNARVQSFRARTVSLLQAACGRGFRTTPPAGTFARAG